MGIDHTLLDQMSLDIESELAKKRLTPTQRRALQMDRLMVMFMRQNIDDRKRIEVLEKSSIGFWIQKNPRVAIFAFTVYVVLSAVVDLRDVPAKTLGVP